MQVFICHASEDKDDFVAPLAKELARRGVPIWYDELDLRWGDSLRQRIDQGLADSRLAIVVLSPAFFSKQWTRYELDGLVTSELTRRDRVILPIWHNVEFDDVAAYSLPLAMRRALPSSDGISAIADRLQGEFGHPVAPSPAEDESFTFTYDPDTGHLEYQGDLDQWYLRLTRTIGGLGPVPSMHTLVNASAPRLAALDRASARYYGRLYADLPGDVATIGAQHLGWWYQTPESLLTLVADVLHQSWRRDPQHPCALDAWINVQTGFQFWVSEETMDDLEQRNGGDRRTMVRTISPGFLWQLDNETYLRRGLPALVNRWLEGAPGVGGPAEYFETGDWYLGLA